MAALPSLKAEEVLLMGLAQPHCVVKESDSALTVRLLADVSRVNEEREVRMEDLVEGATPA
ncbi:hypothetical protein [Streptomyces sp. NPDC059010]|uniref:hypothetical protein n=1 Tax=Streptomyces sp. NPDC059010 TaxID=3346695 RepID=UPI0036A7D594